MSEEANGGTRARQIGVAAWVYAVEYGLSTVLSIATSIALARIIGPQRLGYFNYVFFLITIAGNLGTVGLPMAVRTYCARYLRSNEPGWAIAVYYHCAKLQWAISVPLSAVGALLAIWFGDPDYRIQSLVLIASLPFRLQSFIPSALNLAAGKVQRNLYGGLVYTLTVAISVTASLVFGWDLLGVSLGHLAAYFLEYVVKTATARTSIPDAGPRVALPADMRASIRQFSVQGLFLTIVTLAVFDRSEMVFLKFFAAPYAALTFFTVASSFVERLQVIPKIAAEALGVTFVTDFGDDPEKTSAFTNTALRYLLAIASPVFLLTAGLSRPLVQLLYGEQYTPVENLLILAAVFAVAKPILIPLRLLFQISTRQDLLLSGTIIAAVLTIVTDVVLIKMAGLTGAVVANGLSTCMGLGVLIYLACRSLQLRLDVPSLLRPVFAAGLAAVLSYLTAAVLPTIPALLAGGLVGVVASIVFAKLFRVFDDRDFTRLQKAVQMAPSPVRWHVRAAVGWMCGQPQTLA
jgi:O-antigen/teichoic acid export membrane protein